MRAVYSAPEQGTGDGVLKAFVAANLSFYMNVRRLNRRTFAAKVGVKEPAISKWLSGDQLPRDQYWPKILDVLGVEMADLTKDPMKPLSRKTEMTIPDRDRDSIVRFLRLQANQLGYDLSKMPEQ